MKKIILYSTILLIGLSACNSESTNSTYDPNSLDSSALVAISPESYKNHILKLSSDEFMGRMPFTKGDTLSVNYIRDEFKNVGLAPGNGNSYFQEVPMVEINSKPMEPALTF